MIMYGILCCFHPVCSLMMYRQLTDTVGLDAAVADIASVRGERGRRVAVHTQPGLPTSPHGNVAVSQMLDFLKQSQNKLFCGGFHTKSTCPRERDDFEFGALTTGAATSLGQQGARAVNNGVTCTHT